MRWFTWAMLAVLPAVAFGCSGGGDAEPSAGLPPGLPEGVRLVQATEERPAEVAADEDGRLFFSSDCVEGLLSVTTTREVVYAELPCDRALPSDVKERFLGKPVTLRIAPDPTAKLYLDSKEAGSIEFTVGRMWVAEW